MATGSLTDSLRETLAVFDGSGEPRTTPEVADCLDLGRRSTYNRLDRLVERDRLRTKKVGANARVWWRPSGTTDPAVPDWSAAAESLVDDVLDGVEVGTFVLDENFDVAWINSATERYFGLDRNRVLGEDKRRLVDERIAPVVEDADAFTEALLATYADNTYTEQFECRVTTGDERESRWLEHRSKPIETGAYAGGRVELYYDVTEREHSEQCRREERREFGSLVEAVEDYAMLTLDADGHVRTWNPGAERIQGYEREEILGEHVSTFYTDADCEAGVPEENLAAATEDGSVGVEGWRVRADGTRFWADVTITPIRDDGGDLEGYAKVSRDATDRRRAAAEQQLLYETTRSIAEADTFEEGLRAALQDVCEVTDWEYAEAWLPTDDGELRRAEADYHADGLAPFAAFSEEITFARGEGLPGRVWASGEYEWAADFSGGSQAEYPRLGEALDAGLKSSVGVPVVADGTVVAVLTFLMRKRREMDERLVDMVSSVAAELGEFIDRRQAQERLEREQELVERVFETARVGIAVFGPDRELVRANERLSDLLGRWHDEARTYTAGDVTLLDGDGDPLEPAEKPGIRAFETGEPVVDQEVAIPRADGSFRWVSVDATPLTDADGEVRRVVVSVTDVTQLKDQARRLERRRDELEAELDDIFTRIDDAFYALDEEMRFEYVNGRAEELLGYPETELLGESVWDALSVAGDDPVRERFRTAMETQAPTTFERFSDPSDCWFSVRLYPSESGLSVYFTDITERKKREREFAQYATLFEESKDVNVIVDADGTFRYLTPSVETVFGYDREELVGEVGFDYVHPDDRADAMAEFAKMIDRPGYEPTIEFRFEGADGSWITLEALARDLRDDPKIEGIVVYTRDVTERKERETELERYAGIIDAVGEPVYEIDTQGRFTFVNEAFVERSGYEEDELLGQHISIGMDEEAIARAESRIGGLLADGGEGNTSLEYEVVAKDGERIPVENRISLLTDEDGQVYGSAGILWGIEDRIERRRELERQREELAALDNLNDVVRDITDAVLEQSTREEIEATVCERLAESDSYEFAWIAGVEPQAMTLDPRVEAGVDGYLEEIPISAEPEEASGRGPAGRAIRSRAIRTTQDALSDPEFEPWREHAEEYGFRSTAAIPIVHDDTLYGVLGVYADRPRAFEAKEGAVIGQLGEVVGHAIAAIERKQALTSDEVTEIEFVVPDFTDVPELDANLEGTIALDSVVPTGDGTYLGYGTVDDDDVDALEALVDRLSISEGVTVFDRDADRARFELRLSEAPVVSAVASHGGYLQRARVEDDDFHLTVHLPVTVDTRRLVDAVQEAYPTADMLRRRQITRDGDTLARANQVLTADLTDRQRATLEAAFYAGFFEWPRDATGEEVADSLGIAPSTFSQHLRKGQRRVFESLFSIARA